MSSGGVFSDAVFSGHAQAALAAIRDATERGEPVSSYAELASATGLPADRARGGEVYMLEVKGESMTGDGILDRDHVVVVTDPRPPQGTIAVVLIGEEATVKHVYYEKDALRLKSSNPNFPDQVYRESDFPVIQGRVIGVVRWLPNLFSSYARRVSGPLDGGGREGSAVRRLRHRRGLADRDRGRRARVRGRARTGP
jgi:hypothetical protein